MAVEEGLSVAFISRLVAGVCLILRDATPFCRSARFMSLENARDCIFPNYSSNPEIGFHTMIYRSRMGIHIAPIF